MGVVDSSIEGVIILKTVLKMDEQDDRVFNIGTSLVKNSEWSIVKMCNLVNFNKNYLALQAF